MMRSDFNSSILRVGFVKYPPAVFNSCAHFPGLASRRNCPYPGYCVEIVRFIAKKLQLTIVPVVLNTNKKDIDVGSLTDSGHWKGILGAIANGTVDTACIFYQKSLQRQRDFDFSTQIYSTRPRIAVRNQNSLPLAEMWKLFQPYTVNTWLVIVVQLALLAIIFALIERIECRIGLRNGNLAHIDEHGEAREAQAVPPPPHRPEPFRLVWNLLAMQLLKPGQTQFRSVAGKFLLIVFGLFQCVLITSIYQSWIVSSLVQLKTPTMIKDTKSFVDSIKNGRYSFVSQYKGHWFYESLRFSKAYPFKEMREAVESNPIQEAHSIRESLEFVEQNANVMFMLGDDPAYFQAARYCDIVFVDIEMPHRPAHLVFTKGSPFTRAFNEVIETEKFTIIRVIYERYKNLRAMIHNQECGEREKMRRWYKPLALDPMVGLLAIFALGMSAAMVAFLFEQFVVKKSVDTPAGSDLENK